MIENTTDHDIAAKKNGVYESDILIDYNIANYIYSSITCV